MLHVVRIKIFPVACALGALLLLPGCLYKKANPGGDGTAIFGALKAYAYAFDPSYRDGQRAMLLRRSVVKNPVLVTDYNYVLRQFHPNGLVASEIQVPLMEIATPFNVQNYSAIAVGSYRGIFQITDDPVPLPEVLLDGCFTNTQPTAMVPTMKVLVKGDPSATQRFLGASVTFVNGQHYEIPFVEIPYELVGPVLQYHLATLLVTMSQQTNAGVTLDQCRLDGTVPALPIPATYVNYTLVRKFLELGD